MSTLDHYMGTNLLKETRGKLTMSSCPLNYETGENKEEFCISQSLHVVHINRWLLVSECFHICTFVFRFAVLMAPPSGAFGTYSNVTLYI